MFKYNFAFKLQTFLLNPWENKTFLAKCIIKFTRKYCPLFLPKCYIKSLLKIHTLQKKKV